MRARCSARGTDVAVPTDRYSLLDGSIAPFPEMSMCIAIHGSTANVDGSNAYLAISTVDSAVLCVLLKDLHGSDGGSSVSPLHLRDLELGRHMLRVNGTLVRIRASVDGPRMPSILRPCAGSEPPLPIPVGGNGAAALSTLGPGTNGHDAAATADSEHLVFGSEPESRMSVSFGRKIKKHSRASFTRKSVKVRVAEEETIDGLVGVVHCMLVDGLQGTVLCSRDGVTIAPGKISRLTQELRQNFHAACGQISGFLHAKRGEASKTGAFGAPGQSLGDVIEHGLMFTISASPAPSTESLLAADLSLGDLGEGELGGSSAAVAGETVAYWVVGRLLSTTGASHGREIYVCFEDGTPTDAVEYAFQIDWQ